MTSCTPPTTSAPSGGNTVACVAGLAVLRVIEEEGLVSNARTVGAYLLRRLEEVAARHEQSAKCGAGACSPASTSCTTRVVGRRGATAAR